MCDTISIALSRKAIPLTNGTIQFLYSKDAAGSSVSRNSIRRSNLRCISLDGVFNVTVSSNVAYDTAGHCYYVGYEATDNFIFGNLGASTNDNIGYWDNSPHMNDHDRATFYVKNQQNDFVGNVAAGGGRGWVAALCLDVVLSPAFTDKVLLQLGL